MEKFDLTEKERLLYAMQLEILEKLNPSEDKRYKNLRKAIEEGYTAHYCDLKEYIYEELSFDDCIFVTKVLNMYRGLINSSKKNKSNKKRVSFPGFDGNDGLEGRMCSYVQYLFEDLDGYKEIIKNYQQVNIIATCK